MLRRFARGLEECPGGFRIDLAETGLALGLGESVARSSTTHRSVVRACQFGAAYRVSVNRLAVRTHLPVLTRRQLSRLPEPVQRSHERWARGQIEPEELRRASAAASGLRTVGESLGEVERQLRAWGYPPAAARDAARVAFDW